MERVVYLFDLLRAFVLPSELAEDFVTRGSPPVAGLDDTTARETGTTTVGGGLVDSLGKWEGEEKKED